MAVRQKYTNLNLKVPPGFYARGPVSAQSGENDESAVIRIGRIGERTTIRLDLPPRTVALGGFNGRVAPGVGPVHHIGRTFASVGLLSIETKVDSLGLVGGGHAVVGKERTLHLVVVVQVNRADLAFDELRSSIGGGLELLVGQAAYRIGAAPNLIGAVAVSGSGTLQSVFAEVDSRYDLPGNADFAFRVLVKPLIFVQQSDLGSGQDVLPAIILVVAGTRGHGIRAARIHVVPKEILPPCCTRVTSRGGYSSRLQQAQCCYSGSSAGLESTHVLTSVALRQIGPGRNRCHVVYRMACHPETTGR